MVSGFPVDEKCRYISLDGVEASIDVFDNNVCIIIRLPRFEGVGKLAACLARYGFVEVRGGGDRVVLGRCWRAGGKA